MVEVMAVQKTTPSELKKLYEAGQEVELIDVRTPAEFREVHVAFARNVPLDQLDLRQAKEGVGQVEGKPLYVICRSGSRAEKACQALMNAGLSAVYNVEGGTLACEAHGLPLVRGKKTISLERQVRIAAGSLVLLGVALGALVHPYALGLAAFVGAGLVFAGVTDTCGMAMALARMPWNQVKDGNGTGNGGQCAAPSTGSTTKPPAAGGCCSG